MEYRRKGVSRLELLLELSLAFDDVPLCFCWCSPLIVLNFFLSEVAELRRVVKTLVQTLVAHNMTLLLGNGATVGRCLLQSKSRNWLTTVRVNGLNTVAPRE